MNSDLWAKIKPILHAASILSVQERPRFLTNSCGDDAVFRAEVESLLVLDDSPLPRIGNSLAARCGSSVLDYLASDPQVEVGGYRLLRQLGEGGMSTVYLAVREASPGRRRVALKILSPEHRNEMFTQRFFAERYFLSRLDHPAIVRLLDWGQHTDQRPYLVMQYIAGQPIDRYCETRHLPAHDRIQLLRKVCEIVHYVHENGIVHSDLKPGNILIDRRGNPKLLDFGIAVCLASSRSAADLALPSPLLTPQYASPEQIQHLPLTPAADVYSLGVLLLQLLTGNTSEGVARSSADIERLIREHGSSLLLNPGGPNDQYPACKPATELARAILAALHQDPHQRTKTARQLSESLERVLKPIQFGLSM